METLATLLRKPGIGEKIVGYLDNDDLISLTAVSKEVAEAANTAMPRWVRGLEGGGHGLSKHCLSMITLNWDPSAVMTQFNGARRGKPIQKVLTPLQVIIEQAKKKKSLLPALPMTTTVMLRLRVIGIDPITKLLGDEPNKTTSCAFRTPLAFTVAARRMLEYLMEFRKGPGKDRSGEMLVGSGGTGQHRVTFEYRPKERGFGIHAPASAIFGGNPAAALVGFVPRKKLVEIAATIWQLGTLLKSNGLNDGASHAFVLIKVSELVSDEVSFTDGWIKAIILVKDEDYELFSLYPEPADKQ
jgi:hypothetical protein